MKRKPIYVEIDIESDLDTLWKHTQRPELHQQWDLRFSSIHYLPKGDSKHQRFLYKTRIGFGLTITGIGVTHAFSRREDGDRMSVLRFGSDQNISLIREGSGYWRYRDGGRGVITFSTQYDYKTRFGLIGAWFDRLVFRPMFGKATAWSFDVLRLWLERSIPPAVSIRQTWIHACSVLTLALLWIYEGLVPKLLFPEGGELEMLQHIGWWSGQERAILGMLGVFEICIGLISLTFHKSRWWYRLESVLLAGLMLGALIPEPAWLKAPFNPLLLSGTMLVLCLLASWSSTDLPSASRCLREPGTPRTIKVRQKEERAHDIHL
ncbi:DoxX-like family protein [Paenibacillus lactis]|uniref:DoxX-like family protein n=1 Tax=Paenibacillus lactis TaxID=228574 RepID=UPI0036B36B8C